MLTNYGIVVMLFVISLCSWKKQGHYTPAAHWPVSQSQPSLLYTALEFDISLGIVSCSSVVPYMGAIDFTSKTNRLITA